MRFVYSAILAFVLLLPTITQAEAPVVQSCTESTRDCDEEQPTPGFYCVTCYAVGGSDGREYSGKSCSSNQSTAQTNAVDMAMYNCERKIVTIGGGGGGGCHAMVHDDNAPGGGWSNPGKNGSNCAGGGSRF